MRALARGTWRRKRRAPLQRWNGARQSPATTTPEQCEWQQRAELAKPCVCVLREPEFRTVHHHHGGHSITEGGYWCRVCGRRVPIHYVLVRKALVPGQARRPARVVIASPRTLTMAGSPIVHESEQRRPTTLTGWAVALFRTLGLAVSSDCHSLPPPIRRLTAPSEPEQRPS